MTNNDVTSVNDGRNAEPSIEVEIKARVEKTFQNTLATLKELVSIPSVAWESHDLSRVRESAERVAELARESGFDDVEILTADKPDGGQGMPAVVARKHPRPGYPTVLLYAHHDVQPVGDVADWDTDPWVATEVGDRLYGRGAADDKAGLMTHLASVDALHSVLGEELGIGITLFIEGEEEAGSPSFGNFLATYQDKLQADAIVVADSSNWRAGVPALTTSLRGVISGTVTVRTLDHALHSGMFGGPLVDANTAMVRVLASLHDDEGSVAVDGLVRGPDPELDYAEEDFRTDAGALEDFRLTGKGSISSRLWNQPALSIIGMDITSVDQSSNTMASTARARVSLRLAPGQDPHEAHRLLEEHLTQNAPWGSTVEYDGGEAGQPFESDVTSGPAQAVLESMKDAWNTEPVLMGMGGSIPFVASLTQTFPDAAILITGIEDPDTRAHSANESLFIPDFQRAIESEAFFMVRMNQSR
ncbi:dipeptidase [Kocuria sp. TGY1127_2]|uniref:dipeptidase n=1 Tax=Kocuria sp. TGY1127_2 TaxID=2711328 RepID=UPI0015BD7CFD|nr:dipeptidase [Kocuria sp. TGY1127_2]